MRKQIHKSGVCVANRYITPFQSLSCIWRGRNVTIVNSSNWQILCVMIVMTRLVDREKRKPVRWRLSCGWPRDVFWSWWRILYGDGRSHAFQREEHFPRAWQTLLFPAMVKHLWRQRRLHWTRTKKMILSEPIAYIVSRLLYISGKFTSGEIYRDRFVCEEWRNMIGDDTCRLTYCLS